MLRHVWNCEHLAKGLYWCFQCQKPERVGKFQCRRCQSGSSKTDRIATVAKKMFSALGSKRGIEKSPMSQFEERGFGLSKISEASGSWNSGRISEESMNQTQPSYLDPPYLPELPNSYVSEMENTYVVPEMSDGCTGLSQELPAASVTESSSQNKSTGSQNRVSKTEGASSISHTPWATPHFGSADSRESPRPTRSILPRLNTNTIFEGQNSSHPINIDSAYSNDSSYPMSAIVVSPMSPTGGFDFGTFDALDVSPTDSEASGKSLFTDSGYSSATFESSWNGSDQDFDVMQDHQNIKGKTDSQLTPTSTEKFLGWNSASTDPLILPQISEVTRVNTMTSFDDMTAIHSASRCNLPEKSRNLSPHWLDAQSLVNSFSEVLNEHIRHSRSSLKQMASNSITRELLSLSSSSIISLGFGVLADLLEGRKPTAVLPLFAFTHIAYALAIAVDHDSTKVQTSEWFQDSLSFLDGLASDRQRQTYTQIVRVIWQPRAAFGPVDSLSLSGSVGLPEENENRLIRACKHFLDIQESFSYSENSSSQFDFVQASFANKVKTHKVIDDLIKKSSIEAFIEDVVDVEKRLNNGLITELRQLELELIRAGKLASQSDIAFNRFQEHVMQLCDSLRAKDKSYKPRLAHHLETITTTQQLLPEEEYADDEVCDDEAEFDLDLDLNLPDSGYSTMNVTQGGEIQDLLDMFAREADETLIQVPKFVNPYPPSPQVPQRPKTSAPQAPKRPQPLSSFSVPNNTNPFPLPTSLNQQSAYALPTSISIASTPGPSTPSQANKYRCYCGYEPTGSEEWKASNFARHKRTQHAPAAKVYRCSFPDCPAKYKRSDNLRAHLRLKGHGDADLMLGDHSGEGNLDGEEEKTEMSARPRKRRKWVDDGGESRLGPRR